MRQGTNSLHKTLCGRSYLIALRWTRKIDLITDDDINQCHQLFQNSLPGLGLPNSSDTSGYQVKHGAHPSRTTNSFTQAPPISFPITLTVFLFSHPRSQNGRRLPARRLACASGAPSAPAPPAPPSGRPRAAGPRAAACRPLRTCPRARGAGARARARARVHCGASGRQADTRRQAGDKRASGPAGGKVDRRADRQAWK